VPEPGGSYFQLDVTCDSCKFPRTSVTHVRNTRSNVQAVPEPGGSHFLLSRDKHERFMRSVRHVHLVGTQPTCCLMVMTLIGSPILVL
jgi:hypothetical protein